MRASRLRSGRGKGSALDSGGAVSCETYKHPAIEPIRLLRAPGLVTAHQSPWMWVSRPCMVSAEFVPEVSPDMAEEFSAAVVSCARCRIVKSDGVVLEPGHRAGPVLVREVNGDDKGP